MLAAAAACWPLPQERLARCFFINAPPIFGWLFSALSGFIDKVTRAKITFINTQARRNARVCCMG